MKTCVRCGQQKDESEFYKQGTDNYCKPCRLEVNRINYVRRKHLPSGKQGEVSTLLARKLLLLRGIPTVMGGNHWADLMAWGCVPIEAKLSHPGEYSNQFTWMFSQRQRSVGYQDGLFMFIAQSSESRRVFIVPVDVDWITHPDGRPLHTAVKITLEYAHFNSVYWKLLVPYEDRYDLVEEYRVRVGTELCRSAMRSHVRLTIVRG